MAKWSDFPDATSEAIRLREENAKLRDERDEALRRRDLWKQRAENHVEIVNALKAKTKGQDSRTLGRALLGAAKRELEIENAKLREVNAEQAQQIATRDLTIATQARTIASISQRLEEAEDKLRVYQQEARQQMARSGE